MTRDRLGFVGLGNMGGRMTRRITTKAIDVVGYDAHRPNIAAAGAIEATSAGEVAERSDVVFLSLPDSAVVESVTFGKGGLLDHARPGQVIVDLSTASPRSSRRIAGAFEERGTAFLDAGISGGAAAAEQGTLTLMVGGDARALTAIAGHLSHFASNVFHMGKSGSGHTAKLLNNFLNAVALSATSEVMVAGRKAGLDLATLLDVLNTSSGMNFATLNRFPKIIQGDYLKGGLTNTLMMKDVLLYTDLISELGVAGLHASGPLASFGSALATGRSLDISNTVVDTLGDLSGGVRLSDAGDDEGKGRA